MPFKLPSESEIGQRVSIRLNEKVGGFRDVLGVLESINSVRKHNGDLINFDPGQIFVWKVVPPKKEVIDNTTNVKVFDTKSRKVSPIKQSNQKAVRIYACGPTVYRDAHVGNMRTFLLTDLVVRTLEFFGFETVVIQNITDVGHMTENLEDKMLAQAKLESRSALDIARDYEARFHQDLALLNIRKADKYPRASETIDLMFELITNLIKKENAYVGSDQSVYFDANSFESYGAISGNRLDSLQPGHRYEYTEDGSKRFHADWALWKIAPNRTEMVWSSPWGVGFPGWHIECSAMSMHYLDNFVDLHIGGIDLRFPHHENERAQSNCAIANGKSDEAVDIWLHGEHLLFEGRKMAKSSMNVVLVKDLQSRNLDPLSLRLCFLENRYRSQMDLSWNSLMAADQTITRWRNKYQEWKNDNSGANQKQINEIIEKIAADFANDLDTPRAMQQLRRVEKDLDLTNSEKAKIFEISDQLLGLDLTKESNSSLSISDLSDQQRELLKLRETARASGDFKASDDLRDQLGNLGIEVQDTKSGQTWKFRKG